MRHGRHAVLRAISALMFRAMIVICLALATSVGAETGALVTQRPPTRDGEMPNTRWTHKADHALWNRAALSALKTHGRVLVESVPGDIAAWCPSYGESTQADRRGFWLGFLSALAKHESTYKSGAVGGGGKWFGLLQISPGTARSYDCNARTGKALKNGGANLSCAIRIMAVTVPRDGVIHGRNGRWRGVSADWGPLRSSSKRADMAGWLRKQPYCRSKSSARPRVRPVVGAAPLMLE